MVMTHKSNEFISELQIYRDGRLERDLDDIFKQFPSLSSLKDEFDPLNTVRSLAEQVEIYALEQTGSEEEALKVIRDFVFSQTEGASIAANDNRTAKNFVEWTGLTPEAYNGAMKQSTGVSDQIEKLLESWVKATGNFDAKFPTTFVHILIARSFSDGYGLTK